MDERINTTMMLESEIVEFVNKYCKSTSSDARRKFISDLRSVMNSYALVAIELGSLPETGKPDWEKD